MSFEKPPARNAVVGIVMGSESDYETLRLAEDVLEKFDIPYEISVTSAHRTPEVMYEYAKSAQSRGLKVIIAGAGGAAHLPGMVSALTTLPVLGVPIESRALKGMDSLLSIVQMPGGIPTATFAIGTSGATNAALFAVQILALADLGIDSKIKNYRKERAEQALAGNTKVKARLAQRESLWTIRVGILGGGQLGLLLAQSLVRLGCEVSVYDPDPNAPACKQTERAFNGSWTDQAKLNEFFDECDVITYEFENVETDLLFALQKKKPLMPSASVLNTTQNRGREKGFMHSSGLPHPEYLVVEVNSDLQQAVNEFSLPCIAKTTFGGYDGKGQFLLQSKSDVESLCAKIKQSPTELILEEKIVLDLEVSCIVGRAVDGTEVVFPVFENRHLDHILDVTLLPARVPESVQDKVREIAANAASGLDVVGLLTVEFFLTRTKPRSASAVTVDGWYILINEFAPRPHNSGHITLQACSLSQFDILARVLTGVPLRQPVMVGGLNYCMANLLGEVWLHQRSEISEGIAAGENVGTTDGASTTRFTNGLSLASLADFPSVVDVILYGKQEPRAKRKMGHFVLSGQDSEALVKQADEFRSALARSPYAVT